MPSAPPPRAGTARPGTRSATSTACLVFVAFAAPSAVLGVVWPEVRERFDRPLGALGVLTVAYGIGRFVTSGSAGVLVRRFGMTTSTVAATAVLTASCLAAALAPSWVTLAVAVGALGCTSGALDSLGGRYLAVRADVGEAGLVHGSYGVGATLAPLLAIALAWRHVFLACAALAAWSVVAAAAARGRWPAALEVAPPGAPDDPPAGVGTENADAAAPEVRPPALPAVLSVVAFCLFVGTEVTVGNWALSYLTEGRGASDGSAGVAVAAFWAGITVGRLALGRLGAGRGGSGFLRVTLLVALGALLTTAVVPPALAAGSLLVTGLALAPTIPTLMATTGLRVGAAAAGRVSGWQLLGANVGATSAPAVTGLLVDAAGIGTAALAPVVLVVAGWLVLLAISRG